MRVVNGNLAFSHGFQQGRLSSGRRAVDFVCQDNLGQYGARAGTRTRWTSDCSNGRP